jgi:hypothetical protein
MHVTCILLIIFKISGILNENLICLKELNKAMSNFIDDL